MLQSSARDAISHRPVVVRLHSMHPENFALLHGVRSTACRRNLPNVMQHCMLRAWLGLGRQLPLLIAEPCKP